MTDDHYNQPTQGTEDWDEPLNENFADLGTEVANEVDTWDDLPATGDVEQSSSGQWPVYRVAADSVFVRVTDSVTEVIGGLGSEDHKLPEQHVEEVNADELPGNADRLVNSESELRTALSELTKTEKQVIRVGRAITLSGWVDLDGWSDLTIAGEPGAKTTVKIKDGGTSGHFRVGNNSACGDINLFWLDFDGNKPNVDPHSKEAHASAITGYNADSIEVGHCTVQRIESTSSGSVTENSTGITCLVDSGDIEIHHSYFDDCANRPIESSADSLRVHHNTFTNGRERYVSPSCVRRDGYVTQETHIHDNWHYLGTGDDVGSFIAMHGVDYDGSYGAGAGQGDPIELVHIHDEHYVGAKRTTIALRNIGSEAGTIKIHDVDTNVATDQAIRIGRFSALSEPEKIVDVDVEIYNCTIKNAGRHAVQIAKCSGATVTNCSIKNPGINGIVMQDCPNGSTDSNEIDTPGYDGVRFVTQDSSAGNNRSQGDTVIDAGRHGVDHAGGDHITVRDLNTQTVSLNSTGNHHCIYLVSGINHTVRNCELDGGGEAQNGVHAAGTDGVAAIENIGQNLNGTVTNFDNTTAFVDRDNETR